MELQELITFWDTNEGKPYKGLLIDWEAYEGDGEGPPDNIGCMCAQGQVLHLLGGWSPRQLKEVQQEKADLETAKLLNISVAHAVVLRKVNDSVDGAPSVVLLNPEKILGDQAPILLAFWKHIDRMTGADWENVVAAGVAARWFNAARDAAPSGAAAENICAMVATRDATRIGIAARDAAAGIAARIGIAARDAAAGIAAFAATEIQRARLMRERGQEFYFLPLFGFKNPEEIG